MKTMETELQQLNNELYTMYQRSMEYAIFKWLPHIAPSNGSYNSYPHIRGVMRHIDRLLYGNEENEFSLNGSELYILLCSVLLHDIGRGEFKQLGQNEVCDHGLNSYDIIMAHWGRLGLLTEKAAEIIADICQAHTSKDRMEFEKLHTRYYIDQFSLAEPVRGRLLGALLFLGDRMDNTFTRTDASFFKEPQGIVGKYRSRIADVILDRQYKMIREVLDKNCMEAADLDGIQKLQGDLKQYLLHTSLKESRGNRSDKALVYVIAKDAMDNEQAVALIKDELNIMGMPVKKWLIECDEHLFHIRNRKDQGGNTIIDSVYALEPIINLDYCLEVLQGICMLSGGIFARRYFQYSELVNFLREEESNTYKVKCAVRRLSLLLMVTEKCNYVIYYDENNWSFYCKSDKHSMKKKELERLDRKDVVYEELKELIKERLEDHNEGK